jgi:hypothetical protein
MNIKETTRRPLVNNLLIPKVLDVNPRGGVMSATRAVAPGIPRLQEIEFLPVAVTVVENGGTYDQVRKGLIDYMAAAREKIAPTGNHAAIRLARHDPQRYMHNATEALAELMRLGWVERAQLPTSRKVLPLYQNRHFALTPMGEAWVDKLQHASTEAYEELLAALWLLHPKLAGFLRLLADSQFTVPTANWREVHPGRVGAEGRELYIRFLAARAANACAQADVGWDASEEEIAAAIHAYVGERVAAATRRQRPDPFPRSREFVGACEEALTSYAFRRAGLQIDYISHEILRRWTKWFAVANFSYHVPLAPALRLWATATLVEDDDGALVRVERRTVPGWGDRVIDELPAGYELTRARSPDQSWVPIHQVRGAVCSKLGIGDRIFEVALNEFLAGERRPDAPFRVNLDPAGLGNTPPTEQPLRVRDRHGQLRVYRVMTIVPR